MNIYKGSSLFMDRLPTLQTLTHVLNIVLYIVQQVRPIKSFLSQLRNPLHTKVSHLFMEFNIDKLSVLLR